MLLNAKFAFVAAIEHIACDVDHRTCGIVFADVIDEVDENNNGRHENEEGEDSLARRY